MKNEKHWNHIVCPLCHSAVISLKEEKSIEFENVATFECIGCEIEFDIRQKIIRYCSKCGKEGTTGVHMCDSCNSAFLSEMGFDKDEFQKALLEMEIK